MTNNSLAPLVIAPTDRKKAAVRGDGPPNSTSSEIEHFIKLTGESVWILVWLTQRDQPHPQSDILHYNCKYRVYILEIIFKSMAMKTMQNRASKLHKSDK